MVGIIDTVLTLFIIAIFIRSILTWFPISPSNPLKLLVFQVTEPVLEPLRRYLPRFGYFDLSTMVAIIIVIVIQRIIAANL